MSNITEDNVEITSQSSDLKWSKDVSKENMSIFKNAMLKGAEQAGKKYGNDGLVSYLQQQAIDFPELYLSLLGDLLLLPEEDNSGETL